MNQLRRFSFVLLLVAFSFPAHGQTVSARPSVSVTVPDEVRLLNVDIYSEGTRMAGDGYVAKANTNKKLPTMVMAHGWDGAKAVIRPETSAFGQTGYMGIGFYHRG